MPYNPKACEDEDDAQRMAENIMRILGYGNVQRGSNRRFVDEELSKEALRNIARNAERISRWARTELRRVTPV